MSHHKLTHPKRADAHFSAVRHCRYPDTCRPRRHLELVDRQSICCSSSEASEKANQLLLECTGIFSAGYLPAVAVANLQIVIQV